MRAWCRKFLDSLPTLNYNVFAYVISFFREILVDEETNGSSAEAFKGVCIDCFTGVRTDDILSKENSNKREARLLYMSGVMMFFLTSDEF
jgi:hypothetical protein